MWVQLPPLSLFKTQQTNTMKWILSINGIVIQTEEELAIQVKPMVNEEELWYLTEAIFALTQNDEHPQDALTKITKEHPGLRSCLGFAEAPKSTPGAVSVLSERTTPLDLQIAETAVTGLLSGMEESFRIDESTGFLRVVDQSPPTLDEATSLLERLLTLNSSAERLGEFGNWQLGALLDIFDERFGEDSFSIESFQDMAGAAYATVITALGTYRTFRSGRYQLSFTHHKEAHYCKLPDDDEARTQMHRIMRISEYFQLSCAEQRKLISFHKAYGIENLEPDLDTESEYTDAEIDEIRSETPDAILTREDLVDRVNVKDPRRTFMFTLEGRRYRIKGTLDAIPNGASSIIDTNSWILIQTGGAETFIPEWDRVPEQGE